MRFPSAALPLFLLSSAVIACPHSALAQKAVKTTAPVWTCRSAGYLIRWTDRDLTATRAPARVPAYSVAAALKREFGKPAPDDVVTYYEAAFAPQSVVGPYLSYQRDDSWDGGAHPSGNETLVTVDVRAPKRPVRLTDLFPEDAIRKALLADPVVRRVLKREKITPPASLNALVKALSGQLFGGEDDSEFSFPANLLEDFAFHHVEGDRVAVRFLIPHGSEIYRFRNTQLAVLLPIPPRLKPMFTQAASGRGGALMQTLRRTAGERKTTLVLKDRGATAGR